MRRGQSRSKQQSDSQEKAEHLAFCRICFEDGQADGLIAPCSCIGTQAHVHLSCLRKWQDSLRVTTCGGKRDDRAHRCSVCRELFSEQPRPPRLALRGMQIVKLAACTLCLGAVAFCTSGPPWPQMALLAVLFLAVRSHSIFAVVAMLMGTLLILLHVCGVRLIVRMDAAGRLGLALIRHGAPVEGLGAGVVLVASGDLERSMFRRSVVLLTEHSARGARGVILSQPLHALDPRLAGNAGLGAPISSRTLLRHFHGGPVGMLGDYSMRQEVAILHTIPNVRGALPLLARDQNAPLEAGAAEQLYVGGSMVNIAAAAQHSSASGLQISMYHGVCSWSDGQLEGELRSGAWGFAQAKIEDVLNVPAEQLWHRLQTAPGRLLWHAAR